MIIHKSMAKRETRLKGTLIKKIKARNNRIVEHLPLVILSSKDKQYKYLKVVIEEDFKNNRFLIYLYTTFLKYKTEPEHMILKKELWDKISLFVSEDLMKIRGRKILECEIENNGYDGYHICNVAPCDEKVYFSGKETNFKTYEALSTDGQENKRAVSKINELLKNL